MASPRTYSRLMKFDGAQALEDQIAAFATPWIMNWRSEATVPKELAALHKLTEAALVRAAGAWNRRRHALHEFPLEIFEHCWSFLETADLIQVAATCKLWRQIIHDAPALWTDLRFHATTWIYFPDLGSLLELSKDRLVDLCVNILYQGDVHGRLETVVKPHAHRLRQLELHGSTYPSLMPSQLRLQAPALRVLLSDIPGFHFQQVNSPIKCPVLESLTVAGLELAHWGSGVGYGSVTSLTCGWDGASMERVYEAFPNLVRLAISCNIRNLHHYRRPPAFDLPRDKPPPKSLQRVSLRGMTLCYADLDAFGFTSVRELEIEGETFHAALALFDALGGTPRSVVMQDTCLVVSADGPRQLTVTFDVENLEQYCTVLSRPAVRENITTLSFTLGDHRLPALEPHYVLPADEYPALETLMLPIGHPLLDLANMPTCGKLRAPVLRRLAIIETPRSRCDGAARSMKPLFLAVFIARHLELAPGKRLYELLLDADHGVALCEPEHKYDDGLEILQQYVTTISHKYQPLVVY
ncbi:hypothetical protein AURDEDRAFT_170623 [Auricularia subglabra TFB-10046 SS5]|nr:hypothetical protein AURDEDRAFT_170623 [Auricularia subglabra TFB-10046 SS5]